MFKKIALNLITLPILMMFLSIEIAYAADNDPLHSHNGRQHSHPLPASGLNHQHGGKQKIQPSVKKQAESQTATPSIEDTEQFLQHALRIMLVKKNSDEYSVIRYVYDLQFDGPKFTISQRGKHSTGRRSTTRHIVDLGKVSSIEFLVSDEPRKDTKRYGCVAPSLILRPKQGQGDFDYIFSETGEDDSRAKSSRLNLQYCEKEKQTAKRVSKAFKHLIAQYGVDVKIIDPESVGSAFD